MKDNKEFFKKIKFFWILELLFFAFGVFIVLKYFSNADMQQLNKESSMSVSEKEIENQKTTQYNDEVFLKKAAICIDIDEEKIKPLLAKKTFSKHMDYLYCYNELQGKLPEYITHYWVYDEKIVGQQKLLLNDTSFVVWSKMNMSAEKQGEWRVDILASTGKNLGSVQFILK